MSGRARVTPGGVISSDGSSFEPGLATAFIGNIEAITGSATLTRGYDVADIKLGDPLCQGDVIETAADGEVSIRFVDGTVLSLSNDTCLVLKHFVDDGAAPSALFDVTRGSFAFVAGEMAKAGRLSIDTPVATMRGRTQTGGFGMLSMAALYFAIMDDAHAASSNAALFDDGVIDYKDLAHGVFDVVTKEAVPRHFVVDDPGKTIILHRLGSSVSADFVTNTPTQMAQLQAAQHDALQTYSVGLQQGPTSTGPIGSGALLPVYQPPPPQPINYPQPTITPPPTGPINPGGPDTGPPKPPPVIFVPPAPTNSPITLGADTVKAAPNSAGWAFDPDNGHYYRFVSGDGITWNDAVSAAASVGAYLATITNASENSFVTSHVVQGIDWIGGTDAAQEGTWVWATGPEAGTVFYVNSPQSFPGYSNWNPGEPNNASHVATGGMNGENYLQIFSNGQWNDEQGPNIPSSNDTAGFIEEKGGTPGVVLANFVKNEPTLISTAALLANDTDANGFPLDVTAVAGTSTHGGTVTLNNGVITYTPSTNYIGDDQFTYTVSDGHGGAATGFLSFTVLSDLSQVAADPPLVGVNASDSFTITPQQNDYLGAVATTPDSSGGVDWHFDASPAQLSQLAGLTQYYTVQDQTNPTANQTISVSVGGDGKDQFVFDLNTNGAGTHAIVNFSTATANGTYVGDVIELDNFTNAQNAPLQLADVLTHLTQDSHGNAVVDLGHGDSITFQGVAAVSVQSEAAQIFAFHQHALV